MNIDDSNNDSRRLGHWQRTLLTIGLLMLAIVTAFAWLKWSVYMSYINELAQQTGLNRYLVNVIAALLLIPFYLGIRYFVQFWNWRKRWIGLTVLVCLYAGYNVVLYFATRDHYRGKWYVRTPDGIEFYDRRTEDGRDPVYGYKLKKVTPDVVPDIISLEKGCNAVSAHKAQFFNPTTGEAQVWYFRRSNGKYEFFDGPCHHPQLGVRLEPVTRAVVRDWRNRQSRSQGRQSEAQKQPLESPKSGDDDLIPSEKQDPVDSKPTKDTQQENNSGDVDHTYKQRYVNVSMLDRVGRDRSLVFVATKGPRILESDLALALRNGGTEARPGILRPAVFETSTVIERLRAGDITLMRKMGLMGLSGYLMLCFISFDEPIDTGRLMKIQAHLRATIISLEDGETTHRDLSARGAGFEVGAARRQAKQRLIDDLGQDSVFQNLEDL